VIRQVLERLLAGQDLDAETMEASFSQIMEGTWAEGAQAAFLIALRAKGETAEEIAAAARVLRRFALPVTTSRRPVVDTCGTGGDGAHTLNISTAAALVAAACGVAVAKHGNRSVSSRCGSADVLEALGMPLELEPAQLGELLDAEGFAFLFAPHLHPAMRAVMPVRRMMGVRTIFNLLGPLSSPAGVQRQVVGVYSDAVVGLVAGALAALGVERAWVVHSEDGLDELSVCAPTRCVEVGEGRVIGEHLVDPARCGIRTADRESLAGGDAGEAAERLHAILGGREDSAAAAAVALNAGAVLVVAGQEERLDAAVDRARACLASGAAEQALERIVARARELRT
jgi:anthranilate phosphoribosyltransferase